MRASGSASSASQPRRRSARTGAELRSRSPSDSPVRGRHRQSLLARWGLGGECSISERSQRLAAFRLVSVTILSFALAEATASRRDWRSSRGYLQSHRRNSHQPPRAARDQVLSSAARPSQTPSNRPGEGGPTWKIQKHDQGRAGNSQVKRSAVVPVHDPHRSHEQTLNGPAPLHSRGAAPPRSPIVLVEMNERQASDICEPSGQCAFPGAPATDDEDADTEIAGPAE